MRSLSLLLQRTRRTTVRSLRALSVLCVAALSGAGCTQTTAFGDGNETGLSVVERSKAKPPVWLQMPPSQLVSEGPELRLLTQRSKLINLPLGLRQTQLIGYEDFTVELAKWLASQVAAKAGTPLAALPAPLRAEAERALAQTAEAAVHAQAKVADLYFEGYEDRSLPPGDVLTHFYKVSILMAYPRQALAGAYQSFGDRLGREAAPQLRALGVAAKTLGSQAQ